MRGLSEGFKNAGFEIISQIEMDKYAIETLRTRQLYYSLKEIDKVHLYFDYLANRVTKDEILKKYPDILQKIYSSVIQATFGKDTIDNILDRVECNMKFFKTSRFNVLFGDLLASLIH